MKQSDVMVSCMLDVPWPAVAATPELSLQTALAAITLCYAVSQKKQKLFSIQ